ncbi:MAG: SpoVT/AbrB family protein [Parcubacteria group bacterium GW2011_GWA2_51_10]|nr:MAG: SpoVT/AbrB family protein [Parcubacteria group bacterium GW2011_GWA2_51_10]
MIYKERETTKVSRWGNSLGIRLPARSAARAGISDDTILTVESNADAVTLRPIRERKKSRTLKALLKHVRPIRDREAVEWLAMRPVGKEIW